MIVDKDIEMECSICIEVNWKWGWFKDCDFDIVTLINVECRAWSNSAYQGRYDMWEG